MEETVDITQTTEVVDAPSGPVTSPAPAVSTDDRRIRDLMSQLDKTRNELRLKTEELNRLQSERNQAVSERAETQRARQNEVAELRQQLDEAVRATQDALNREQGSLETNATLQRRLARFQYLSQHPELTPFAELLPETTDVEELDRKANVLRKGIDENRQAIKEQLKAAMPPPSPAPEAGGRDVVTLMAELRSKGHKPGDAEWGRLISQHLAQNTG